MLISAFKWLLVTKEISLLTHRERNFLRAICSGRSTLNNCTQTETWKLGVKLNVRSSSLLLMFQTSHASSNKCTKAYDVIGVIYRVNPSNLTRIHQVVSAAVSIKRKRYASVSVCVCEWCQTGFLLKPRWEREQEESTYCTTWERKEGQKGRWQKRLGGGRRVNVSGHCQLRDPWVIQQLSHSHNTRINCHPAHFDTR